MGADTGPSPDEPKLEADMPALEAMQRELARRTRAADCSPRVYCSLAEGSQPLPQAMRADRNIALQYIDENGRPVYYTIQNVNAAATIGTNQGQPGRKLSVYNM